MLMALVCVPLGDSFKSFMDWADKNCPGDLTVAACQPEGDSSGNTPYDYCKRELASVVLTYIQYVFLFVSHVNF